GDGRGAHRRAVHGHGDLPPAPRLALAPARERPRRASRRAALDPARGGNRRAAGWPPRLQHLLARDGRERRADRELPLRQSGVAPRAAAGGRGARRRARCGASARTPAAPWHRRRVRGEVASRGTRDGMTWRAHFRSALVYLVAIVAGFSLAYLLVAFVIFPVGVIPRDVKVPNVTGLDF